MKVSWGIFLILFQLVVGNKDHITVGEEMEIELSMFIHEEEQGKLYKERFNFASHDCGASIVKTNRQAKRANSILNDNKDSYLLNPCNSNSKYVIIELCEDILIDEIEISNFEFYSSMFKDFKVSVSDRFPTTNWIKLGEFNAQNLRIQQRFQIENSIIWVKFIKFEILNYYGDEYYCPISSIQVFGTRMIEQLKDEEKSISINNSTNFKDDIKSNISSLIQQTQLIDDSIYQNDIIFSEIDYEQDCIARPIIPMDKFLNKFNEDNQQQCSIDELNISKPIQSPLILKQPQPQPQPQPKDSIYKNINKRLEELERNSTISLLYQMEQSKIMSDAFLKFESLQLNKFQNLISELNSTHISHLNLMTMLSRDVKLKNQLVSKEISKINENNFLSLSREISILKFLVFLLIILNLLLICYILFNKVIIKKAGVTNKTVDILGIEFKFKGE